MGSRGGAREQSQTVLGDVRSDVWYKPPGCEREQRMCGADSGWSGEGMHDGIGEWSASCGGVRVARRKGWAHKPATASVRACGLERGRHASRQSVRTGTGDACVRGRRRPPADVRARTLGQTEWKSSSLMRPAALPPIETSRKTTRFPRSSAPLISATASPARAAMADMSVR